MKNLSEDKMRKRIISIYLAVGILIMYMPVCAATNRKNLTESFSISEMIVPTVYHSCQSGEGLRNTEGGPVVYSANESGYEGYYITAPELSEDKFLNAYKYMCTGAVDEAGNRIEMKTKYIERNSYWVYMPSDGLLRNGESLDVGDGIYFSFYYRSAPGFISPTDGKTYTGEDVSFKTCFVHNSGYGTTSFSNIETFKNPTMMVADGKWHRVEFIGQVNSGIMDRINNLKEGKIPFLICFEDLSKQSFIEMTGFRMGILDVNQENSDNSYSRIYTEMSWHLSKNSLDSITVNGTELNLINGKSKYTVKNTSDEVSISGKSNSGATYEVIKNTGSEYVIKVKSAGYDFTKNAGETVTYQEKVNALTGDYFSLGTRRAFSVKNSDMYKEQYTIYLNDNIFSSPLRDFPETPIFTGSSDEFKKEEYLEWLSEGLSENMVEEVLWGNIAFVKNNSNYWVSDEKFTAPHNALIFENGEYYILSQLADEIFGVKSEELYIMLNEVVNATDYEIFIDPRGFVLFSRHMEQSIDKSPVKQNDLAYRHYKSYYAVTMAIGEITWNNITPSEEDYTEFETKREEMMLVSPDIASSYGEFITNQISTVSAHMDLFDENNENLFTDSPSVSVKYSRMLEMAKCYKMLENNGRTDLDCEKLLQMILALLENLYNTHFSKNEMLEPVENWFANLITYPTKTADTLLLIREKISPELTEKYVNAWNIITADPCITKFQVPYKYDTHNVSADLSNPCSNYTNLLWRSHTVIKLNALIRNSERINRTLKYLSGIFEYTSGSKKSDVNLIKDGFYEDGSFVFHSYYAYNTGYGKSYTAELAELLSATVNTAFDVKNIYGYENIYNFMTDSWIPFITGNQVTKFASGRELPTQATPMVTAMLIILSHAPENVKQKAGTKLKAHVSMNSYKKLTSNPGNYYSYIYPTLQQDINEMVSYINTLPDTKENYSNVYYNKDRVIHKKNYYTFMHAMSSERTDRYEAIQEHGYSDWYIGDGMTCFITDSRQYHIGWWSRADKYKIPGTTVDSTERNPNTSKYGNHNAENEWAGGATDGNITVAGMILPGNITDSEVKLTGKKSYFMLDNEIVCMGSNIKGGNCEVYTTVDNLWLKSTQDEVLTNGTPLTTETDKKEYYENPEYMWTDNRGYVFMGENTLSCERAVNNKRYTGAGKTNSRNTEPFLHILLEHGASPENASYIYAVLPNATKEETANYSKNPDFEVISASSTLHAIKLTQSGIMMANIFEPTTISGINFNTPCSVILKPYGNGYKIYVSDPTHKKDNISVEFSDDKTVCGGKFTENGISIDIENPGKTYQLIYSDFMEDKGKITSLGEKTPLIAAYLNDKLLDVSSSGTFIMPEKADEIKAFYWKSIDSLTPEKTAETLTFLP